MRKVEDERMLPAIGADQQQGGDNHRGRKRGTGDQSESERGDHGRNPIACCSSRMISAQRWVSNVALPAIAPENAQSN